MNEQMGQINGTEWKNEWNEWIITKSIECETNGNENEKWKRDGNN